MSSGTTGLSLYHFQSCRYCARVRRALVDLKLDVQLEDIHRDPAAHTKLVEAMGRETVPVLHIETGSEESNVWMPESADIVRYLYERFGQGRKPPLLVGVHPQWLMVGAVLLLLALFMALR